MPEAMPYRESVKASIRNAIAVLKEDQSVALERTGVRKNYGITSFLAGILEEIDKTVSYSDAQRTEIIRMLRVIDRALGEAQVCEAVTSATYDVGAALDAVETWDATKRS